MKISVVSKSDTFDWTAFCVGLVRIGEIEVSSVDELVKKVSRRCIAQSDSIERLDIFAHGSGGAFSIGDDHIGGVQRPRKDPLYRLASLKGFFSDDGIVVLCVCEAGKGDGMLIELSRTVGVPVYATVGDVSPNLGFSNFGFRWGITVAAYPDGTSQRNVRIPVDPWEGPQS
jgi:hypothetical protein